MEVPQSEFNQLTLEANVLWPDTYNEAFICFNHIKRPLRTTQLRICTHFYRQLTIELGKLSTRPLMSQANWILIRNLRKYVNNETGVGSNCAPFQWLALSSCWWWKIISLCTDPGLLTSFTTEPAKEMITDSALSRNVHESLLFCVHKHCIYLTPQLWRWSRHSHGFMYGFTNIKSAIFSIYY